MAKEFAVPQLFSLDKNKVATLISDVGLLVFQKSENLTTHLSKLLGSILSERFYGCTFSAAEVDVWSSEIMEMLGRCQPYSGQNAGVLSLMAYLS